MDSVKKANASIGFMQQAVIAVGIFLFYLLFPVMMHSLAMNVFGSSEDSADLFATMSYGVFNMITMFILGVWAGDEVKSVLGKFFPKKTPLE